MKKIGSALGLGGKKTFKLYGSKHFAKIGKLGGLALYNRRPHTYEGKLPKDRLEAMKLLEAKGLTQKDIGRLYGITRQRVSKILMKK